MKVKKCVCPTCGYKHNPKGKTCMAFECPKCGKPLLSEHE